MRGMEQQDFAGRLYCSSYWRKEETDACSGAHMGKEFGGENKKWYSD